METAGPLDREDTATYEFAVYVTDGSFHFDTCVVVVSVLDVNDHSPKFRDSCHPLYVPENNELKVIHTLVASDEDVGPNADIVYSITGEKPFLEGNLSLLRLNERKPFISFREYRSVTFSGNRIDVAWSTPSTVKIDLFLKVVFSLLGLNKRKFLETFRDYTGVSHCVNLK